MTDKTAKVEPTEPVEVVVVDADGVENVGTPIEAAVAPVDEPVDPEFRTDEEVAADAAQASAEVAEVAAANPFGVEDRSGVTGTNIHGQKYIGPHALRRLLRAAKAGARADEVVEGN